MNIKLNSVTISYSFAIFFFIGTNLLAKTIYVPADFPTIQTAIDAAVHDDTILVANGLYTGTNNRNINLKGKVIKLKSIEGPDNCIIDCQKIGRGFFIGNQETRATLVEGFSIINGYATDTSYYGGFGGGFYCSNSSPTIRNCKIQSCFATGSTGGGGIFLNNSQAYIENVLIENNIAPFAGAGLFAMDSIGLEIRNSKILSNKTTEHSSGAGLFFLRSEPIISNCTISYNESNVNFPVEYVTTGAICTNSGGISFRNSNGGLIENSTISYNMAQERGGIGCWEASPKIRNCIIEYNKATVFGGGGCGFYSNSNPEISDSVIRENSAIEYGGGISIWNSSLSTEGAQIMGCLIENNSSSIQNGSSGGVNIYLSSTDIINCWFKKNKAYQKSALHIYGSSHNKISNSLFTNNETFNAGGTIGLFKGPIATILNCTIANNYAGIESGGVYCLGSSPIVYNSIIWGNSNGPITAVLDSHPNINFSNIENLNNLDPDFFRNGNIDSNPIFESSIDFHIKCGSSSRNKGSAIGVELTLTDLDGMPRIYPLNSSLVDMGAYEINKNCNVNIIPIISPLQIH